MKYFSVSALTLNLTLIFTLSLSVKISAQQFRTDDPVAYNQHIIDELERTGKEFVKFSMTMVNAGDAEACEQQRIHTVRQLELSLRRLRNMAGFKGDHHLKNEAIEVFLLYKKLHTEKYARISQLVSTQNSSLERLEEYFQLQVEAEKLMHAYQKRMRAAQKQFAKQHRITIIENGLQAQYDRILEGNIYSREIFLAYIAVAKHNQMWWEAMQKDDYPAMLQHRTDLLQSFKTVQIGQKDGFLGNTEFRDAARDRIAYYHQLATAEYPKIRSILENDSRTAADVEWVNGIILEYNQREQELNNRFNEANRNLKNLSLKLASGGK